MVFTDVEIERYARHLVLREVGGPGQQKLKAASVLIVGAGGLGSPAALYLAAAGVGTIILADPDRVDRSNLQRQILYAEDDIGRPKAEAASDRLAALNPHIFVAGYDGAFDASTADELVEGVDLVLDGTDDFAVRFAVNDACVRHGKTLVSGAIGRWTGQVGIFGGRPCYRCLVPEIPPDAETCSAVGVVGALAGVIGSMMALEAIKLIAGAGEPLSGRLLIYDGLAAETRTVKVGGRSGVSGVRGVTARLVPELDVSDLDVSLAFYVGVLGFSVRYQRPEERFAYLERDGAELMLEESAGPGRRFHTAPLEQPLGRGMNLQIQVADAQALLEKVRETDGQVIIELEDRWYRRDTVETGNRQFVVADPDGYLLRFFEDLGARI